MYYRIAWTITVTLGFQHTTRISPLPTPTRGQYHEHMPQEETPSKVTLMEVYIFMKDRQNIWEIQESTTSHMTHSKEIYIKLWTNIIDRVTPMSASHICDPDNPPLSLPPMLLIPSRDKSAWTISKLNLDLPSKYFYNSNS